MRLPTHLCGALLALAMAIPSFGDDQQKAEKQLHKITAMATDGTGRRVVSITLADALGAKRLGLLHELVPSAKTVAYLANPANPSFRLEVDAVQEAAKAFDVDLQVLNASTDLEIEAAFARLAELHAGAIIVAGEPFFDSRRAAIVELAAKHSVPASYSWRENVAMGGLLSYGTSITHSYRNSGIYCGRILKGERPGDLPVMQPTKFEMTLNLKTAKALSLTVPPALLTGADEVIE